jgi:hypothetical protein
MVWDSNKPTWDEIGPKPIVPVVAGTIYVPSYQERPDGLINYFVNWLSGNEQSREPVKTLAPQRLPARLVTQDSLKPISRFVNCTPRVERRQFK